MEGWILTSEYTEENLKIFFLLKNHFAIEAKTYMEASSSGVEGFATGGGSNIEIRIFRKKLGEKTSLKPYI